MRHLSQIAAITLSVSLLGSMPVIAAQTLEGDANVDQRNYPSTAPFIHPPFYNAKVTVEVDDEGVITSVTDNGTGQTGSVEEGNEELWENKNKPFWETAVNSGVFDTYAGKTLEEVKEMDPLGADAVSGATMAGAAIHEAVINALEGKAGKTFLPGTGNVLPVEEIKENQVIMNSQLPEDFDVQIFDIRYGVYNAEEDIVPAEEYTAEVVDNQVVLTFQDLAGMKPGKYFVNIVDGSGKYRSPNFEKGHGEGEESQAPFFVIDSGLAEDGIAFDGTAVTLSEGDVQDYMKNIDHVLILADGAEEATEQEPVGHHGTVNTSYVIFDADGAFHADGIVKGRDGSETPLFEDGVSYTITIEAFGYPSVSFPYTKGDAAASEDAGEEGTEEAAEAATEAAAEEVTEAAAEAATEAAAETATEAAAEEATEAAAETATEAE